MTDAASAILGFVPLLVVQAIYAIVVFLMARKRRTNPWFWTVGALVPLFGVFVSAVFVVLTLLSILDRLNALEESAPASTFG